MIVASTCQSQQEMRLPGTDNTRLTAPPDRKPPASADPLKRPKRLKSTGAIFMKAGGVMLSPSSLMGYQR
ncbi:MAG: hypothetical protein IPO00_03185 [Betaproteobacteria bacterium]|nr:hypothetical protein [Betaproteobacteria bacterium]